ncbi:MAG: HXXEE domain-containing protein [Peptococcaceae bacterium]
MKKKFFDTWYYTAVYIAAFFALLLVLGDWSVREKMLLGSLIFIFLHFFEEFGFPGGFPYIGMKVELGIDHKDTRTWPLNQVNAMFGNFCFAVLVYLLPLFLSELPFLTLAAAVFAFAEVLMHLLVFNVALKTWYNPGLLTAVFGLLPVSLFYFSQIWGQHLYSVADIALAIVWIVFNYWLAFRSPIYKTLGNLSGQYGFTEEEVNKADKYIKTAR